MISPLILSLSNIFSFLNLTSEANHAILVTCNDVTTLHLNYVGIQKQQLIERQKEFKMYVLMKLIVVQNKVVQKLNLIQVQSQNLLLFFLLNQTSSDNSQVTNLSL